MRTAGAASLPLLPVVVLTAGQTFDPSQFPPGWPVAAHEQLQRELQADLASLVPNSRHVIAERSGHYIHQAEPDLVVDAIRQVVAAVRDPSTWETAGMGTPNP